MINKFLKKLKELDLPKGEFAIFGSGPMCVKGLRETGDLDVIVSEDLFNILKNKEKWPKVKGKPCESLEKDEIEVCKEWGPGEWDVNKLIREAEIIDELPFVRLEEVLKWKKIYNRDKDKKDIKLIEEYLNKN